VFFTVVCFPVGLFAVASGFIFGLWLGGFTSWLGSTVGACLAFILGKRVFQTCVEELAQQYPLFGPLDNAISLNAWKIVFLMRISPLVPFNVMNYLLSLTRVGFWDYTSATAAGLLPPTLLFVYIGTVAKNLNETLASQQSTGVFLVGVVLTIFSIVLVTQISAKVIKAELANSQPEAIPV